MRIVTAPQRSEEWYAARLGRATASRFADVMATIKTGEAAARKNYRAQLICERLTGKMEESFESGPMKWGTETEPLARVSYELATGRTVSEIGFCQHDELMAGCSPDGIVDDGLIEIKCPNTATHIEAVLAGRMPSGHIPQVQGQMWITGRMWCDFVSFDPRLPPHLQLFVQRIERDEKYIKGLETAITDFLGEVDGTILRLQEVAQRKAA